MNHKTLIALFAALFGLSATVAGCATDSGARRASAEEEDGEDDRPVRKRKGKIDAGSEDDEGRPPRLHGPKKRIGIVDFDDASHGQHGYWSSRRNARAETARDAATEVLVKSGAFVVIEREQIAQVLKEQGLGMTGAISPQTAAKAGKLLGLQAIVTGKITDFEEESKRQGFGGYDPQNTRTFHARISLRMVDATSGEIWLAESGEGAADSK